MEIKEILSSDFRGNVYVVQDGRVLYKSVTGFADLSNEIPNTLETRFASASAGKVFVAVGILQLIEQGKLRFDDTLGELLDIEFHHIDTIDLAIIVTCQFKGGITHLFKLFHSGRNIFG